MIKHIASIAVLMLCQHLQCISQNVGQSLVDHGLGLDFGWGGVEVR